MQCQGFEWEFPLYTLALRETITLDDDGLAKLDDAILFIAPESLSGRHALAMFTAHQLAQEFHQQASAHHDLVLFNIPDADSLWKLLKQAEGLYGHVLFDPKAAPLGIRHICEVQALLRAVDQERGRKKNQGDH